MARATPTRSESGASRAGAGIIHGGFGDTIGDRSAPCCRHVAELLRQYFRIAFLMGRPQDLPTGSMQMRIGLALAFVTYMLALIGIQSPTRMIAHVVLDLGCTALVLQVALALVGHPGRFEQAFGGLCGASAFINLAAVPLYRSAASALDSSNASFGPDTGLIVFGQLMLLVWSLSLLAHVVRHTFEVRMWVSIVIAVAFVMTLLTLLDVLLPMQAPSADLEPSAALCFEPRVTRMI